jgi:translation elongation factor EF-4
VVATILTPSRFAGRVLQLCAERRGDLLEHTLLAPVAVSQSVSRPASSDGRAGGPATGAQAASGVGGAQSVEFAQGRQRADGSGVAGQEPAAGDDGRTLLRFVLPLSELASDLHGRVKGCTQG